MFDTAQFALLAMLGLLFLHVLWRLGRLETYATMHPFAERAPKDARPFAERVYDVCRIFVGVSLFVLLTAVGVAFTWRVLAWGFGW